MTDFNGTWALNPTNIAQVALSYYAHYYENEDDDSKEEFLKLAYWLKENVEYKGNIALWHCYVDFENYNLESGWVSAMGQGFIISVLLEAYAITNDKWFSFAADDALGAFEMSLEEGGVRSSWGKSFFYEEYAGNPPAHVLNGFLFSLAGLYDHHRITGSFRSNELLHLGFDWLEVNLNQYDADFSSYYSQIPPNKQYANAVGSWPFDSYHELHVAQLLWAYDISGVNSFFYTAYDFLQLDLNDFYRSGKLKLDSVRASSSIDPLNYGPDKLTDGYWSYNKYWSCKSRPCELEVSAYGRMEDISEIRLYTLSKEQAVTSVEIEVYIDDSIQNGEEPIKCYESKSILVRAGENETLVQIFPILPAIEAADKIIIRPKAENPVIAIREIDLSFDRTNELLDFLEKFDFNSEQPHRQAPTAFGLEY